MSADPTPRPAAEPGSGTTATPGGLRGRWRRTVHVASTAGTLWSDHHAARIAAALAFYTLFSLAPILVVATAIAGAVWGREAVQGELVSELAEIVGVEGGRLLQDMIANAYTSARTGWAAVIGVLVVLVGASAVFAELRMAFKQLWNRDDEDRDAPIGQVVMTLVRARLRGLAVVVGIGFVLLASLALSSTLVAMGAPIARALESIGGLGLVVAALPILASVAVTGVMIALLLAVLVPGRPPRRQLVAAAMIGAVVFELAKYGVSFYLGRSAMTSVFGAAGSLAVLLVWLYAASAVVLLSAVLLRAMGAPAARPRGGPAAVGA